MAYISATLRKQVAERARYRCEYCLSLELITGGLMHIEHIVPQSQEGTSELENLAYACARCNLHKATRTHYPDPLSEQRVSLFNPRQHKWTHHFEWSADATQIIGRTPTGRATVVALQINHLTIVKARSVWVNFDGHPPVD
jgi:hypothetical protein